MSLRYLKFMNLRNLYLPKTSKLGVESAATEQKLHAQIFDRLPVTCLAVDDSGVIAFCSESITNLLGWQTKDLIDKSISLLLASGEDAKLKSALNALSTEAAKNRETKEISIEMCTMDKQLKQVHAAITRLEFEGRSLRLLTLCSSVLQNLELRLAKEQAMAYKHADESKSRFISNISHEIRTPLNSVLGMIDLLVETPITSQQRDYLHNMKNSSRSLRSLVDAVLDFSKIEAGLVQLDNAAFDLAETIRSAVRIFTSEANKANIALEVDLTLDQECYVGDAHRITQVINNLLSNAMKFTATGSIRVSASSRMLLVDKNLSRLTISVTDTGIGVALAQQAGLFEIFQQANVSVGSRYGGSGLGLYICRQLVALMGGEISMSSQLGIGSKFEFWLDLEPSHSPVEFIATAPPAQMGPLEGARILVVEDDLANRTLLQAWLHQASAISFCCSNGKEAIDEIENGPRYDAVLMDVSMPVMDGLTATRQIRGPRPLDSLESQRYLAELVIIGISGHAFTEDITRCLEAGMTNILTKPLNRVFMLQTLSSALEKQNKPN